MAVKILGPLETGTEPLSPRERAILSALLVRMGTAVSLAELADAYWGERAPATWGQQIKTSIARIRARLGPETVITSSAGYRCGLDPESIDAVRFERLVSAARGHALRGQQDRAADAYRRALALWRGSPYPDLPEWEPARAEQLRLAEIRAGAEEELLEARLAGGERRAVVPDAERLVREQPLREDRWAILALANYRADRQAEALAAIRTARRRLLEELGIEPGRRLTELEVAILRQDPSLAPPVAAPEVSAECPYRGLQAFGPQDAEVFFGRDTDVERVLERLRPGALVTIAGSSGSGKSSVMLAGVAPQLRQRGRQVDVLRPTGGGVEALRHAIEQVGSAGVLAVDQAEELVAGLADPEVDTFCHLAREHLDGGGLIVAAIRSDFLDRAAMLPEIGDAIARDVVLLGPLSEAGLRAAIEEPARRAGLLVEPGLTEVLLRDAGGRSAVLPHLSHALLETWVRREGSTLTVDGYEASGGLAGAIAQSAEELYRSLSPREQELTRSLLLRLVERNADGSSIRRPVPVEPLRTDPERRRVVEGLTAFRLVAIDSETVLIAHEAVAPAWPRLDGWLNEDADGLRLLRQLESAAAAWDVAGRGEEELLRGARLHAVLDWQAATNPDLTDLERALLEASERQELAERHALEQRARRDRQQNRRLRWALGGAGGLLVVALAAGGTAVVRSSEATASREEALRESLVSTSLALRGSDRDVAALLAAEAYRRWPEHPASRAALMGTMTAAKGYTASVVIPDVAGRVGTALIPGTRTLAVARSSGAVELRDLDTMELRRSLVPALPPAEAVVRPWLYPSADGSTLAVVRPVPVPGGDIGQTALGVYAYDLESGRRILAEPVPVAGYSDSFALSPDGRFLAWVEFYRGDLSIAETTTGATRTVPGLGVAPADGSSAGVPAFGADGALLVGSGDGRLLRVDVTTLAVEVAGDPGVGAANLDLVPLPGGGTVLAGHSRLARLDSTGAVLWSQQIGADRMFECGRVLVSEPQSVVFCADQNGLIEVRSLATGAQVSDPLSFEGGGVGGMYLLDENTLVATSTQSALVSLWRIDGGGPVSRVVAPGLILWDGYDPAGRYLVAATPPTEVSEDAFPTAFSVWDAATGQKVLDVTPGADATWLGADRLLVYDENPTDPELPGSFRVLDPGTGESTEVGDLTVDLEEYGVSPADGSVYGVFRTDSDPVVFTVKVFDGTSLRATGREFDFGQAMPQQPSFTPDGRLVSFLTWQQGPTPWETRVFDTAGGELVARGMTEHTGSALLPSGDVVGSSGYGLAVYSGNTLQRSRALPRPPSASYTLVVSDDGTTLLVWTDGVLGVSLYDLTGNLRLGDSLARGGGPLRLGTADLRSDGRQLAFTSPDGIAVWDLDPAAHFEAACRIAGRELTADEWSTYLAEFGPQRSTCG